ncbi:MAG: cytochrome c [Magnetococcales bacterium]|nr:cytochrome c [Magnetococcales bacterium]NGZ25304.1 cytochrome c [Magnetococcales bacterium]
MFRPYYPVLRLFQRVGLLFSFAVVYNTGWADISPQRSQELLKMVRHDCGSCHGYTLKGGLGPPLLPADLAGKDPEFLEATIAHGRSPQAMPPWLGLLTQEEIRWLVQRLIRGEVP